MESWWWRPGKGGAEIQGPKGGNEGLVEADRGRQSHPAKAQLGHSLLVRLRASEPLWSSQTAHSHIQHQTLHSPSLLYKVSRLWIFL